MININVLDIGDKILMLLLLKFYIILVGVVGGVVIKVGEVIVCIYMYKIVILGSGNLCNFMWNIILNNNVVMLIGGCIVDSCNVIVDFLDFSGSVEIFFGVYCLSE